MHGGEFLIQMDVDYTLKIDHSFIPIVVANKTSTLTKKLLAMFRKIFLGSF